MAARKANTMLSSKINRERIDWSETKILLQEPISLKEVKVTEKPTPCCLVSRESKMASPVISNRNISMKIKTTSWIWRPPEKPS